MIVAPLLALLSAPVVMATYGTTMPHPNATTTMTTSTSTSYLTLTTTITKCVVSTIIACPDPTKSCHVGDVVTETKTHVTSWCPQKGEHGPPEATTTVTIPGPPHNNGTIPTPGPPPPPPACTDCPGKPPGHPPVGEPPVEHPPTVGEPDEDEPETPGSPDDDDIETVTGGASGLFQLSGTALLLGGILAAAAAL